MRGSATSLDSLEIFARTVELGSFSAAGRALRLSAQVVSYRIQALETELGCRLLVRTTRRMNLTGRGQLFYQHCLEIMEAVERARMSVTQSGDDLRGPLRITAPLGLGRHVIAPLADAFCRTHPHVELRLRLSDHLLDLVHESIDVAVRMARFEDSSMTIRKIADVERVLCASPRYLAERGVPDRPESLLDHRCLLLRYPGTQQYRWTLEVEGEPRVFRVSGPLDADDGDVLTRWALTGAGIVLKPKFEVAEELASGRLVPVLTHCPPTPVTLAALYPARHASQSVRAFVDTLVTSLRLHIGKALEPL